MNRQSRSIPAYWGCARLLAANAASPASSSGSTAAATPRRSAEIGPSMLSVAVAGAAWRFLVFGAVVMAFLISAFALAGLARAEVRSVTVTDPADAMPTVSGAPENPDLSKVTLTYDNSTGTVTVVQDFYNSLPSVAPAHYAYFTGVLVGPSSTRSWAINGSVEEETCASWEGFSSVLEDRPYAGAPYSNSFSVLGYSGTGSFMTTVENGGLQVTSTATSPALVGHDWRCASVDLSANTRSTVNNPHSFWDSGCECWAVTTTLDTVGIETVPGLMNGTLWFPGFPTTRPKPETPLEKEEKQWAAEAKAKQEAAQKKKETLTETQAERYMTTALRRGFGSRFTGARPRTVSCGETSSKEQHCWIAFSEGKLVKKNRDDQFGPYVERFNYVGKGRVWLHVGPGGAVEWNYAYRIKRIDHSCTLRRAVKACSKMFIVS